MKRLLGIVVVLFAVAAFAQDVVLPAGRTEVVIAADAPKTVRFAASEATNFLSRIFGAAVPVVSRPTGGGVASLVLGENAWSRTAGVSFDTTRRDAFTIAAKEGCVYIVGSDDPTADPFALVQKGDIWNLRFERATLFGVYEFFERYADCRFYFPGECGTILPRAGEIRVPEGTLSRAPDFTSRNPYMGGNGFWYEGDQKDERGPSPGKVMHWFRLRCETENAPCCHGSRGFKYIERFAKTHPECLALKKDGSRWDDPTVFAAYQLCWTNPFLKETMYEDVKAYLTGQKPETRGLKTWGWHCSNGKFVDIMPEDSFEGCWCKDCQASYDRSKRHYANNLMWGFTADLARRLKAEGVPGTITQMSYLPYGEVPEFELPDNILVIVAQSGPWSVSKPGKVEQEAALFKAWQEKTNRRVQTWTYPHKFGGSAIPGVPDVAPRAFGAYWKRVAPYVSGGFLETESERAIYNYLNYYVFSKIAWDPTVDVEALLADHNRRMFGKGAAEMDAFFRLLEEKWMYGIVGNVKDTALGPVAQVPPVYEVWTRVYSKMVLAELAGRCDAAVRAAGAGTDEAKRVAFIRTHFLKPLETESQRYLDTISVEKALARRAAEPNRTILTNGDFDTLAGWEVEPDGAEIAFDTTEKVTGKGALRMTCTNRTALVQSLDGKLKPDTRYRVSWFMKLENVKSITARGGVYGEFLESTWTFFPRTPLVGTVDWHYQSHEFKTGKKFGQYGRPYFHFLMLGVTGTAWFDDVRIEEIK